MKTASIVIFILILLVSGFSVYSINSKNLTRRQALIKIDNLKKFTTQTYSQSMGDKKNRGPLIEEYENAMREISELEKREASKGLTESTKVWIKLGFSIAFGLAALFIVLSKRYNEETQKWAFSTLSLLAGVWIGTIS